MDNIISIAKFYIPHCLTMLVLDIRNLVHTEIHIGEYNTWHNRSDGFWICKILNDLRVCLSLINLFHMIPLKVPHFEKSIDVMASLPQQRIWWILPSMSAHSLQKNHYLCSLGTWLQRYQQWNFLVHLQCLLEQISGQLSWEEKALLHWEHREGMSW